jgi:hypothetical protein
MTVTGPETTAFDLVRFPEEAGYWSNGTPMKKSSRTYDPKSKHQCLA